MLPPTKHASRLFTDVAAKRCSWHRIRAHTRQFAPRRGAQLPRALSERGLAVLAGPNAHDLRHVRHEDLAVAAPAGLRAALDRIEDRLDMTIGREDLDLHLRH